MQTPVCADRNVDVTALSCSSLVRPLLETTNWENPLLKKSTRGLQSITYVERLRKLDFPLCRKDNIRVKKWQTIATNHYAHKRSFWFINVMAYIQDGYPGTLFVGSSIPLLTWDRLCRAQQGRPWSHLSTRWPSTGPSTLQAHSSRTT